MRLRNRVSLAISMGLALSLLPAGLAQNSKPGERSRTPAGPSKGRESVSKGSSSAKGGGKAAPSTKSKAAKKSKPAAKPAAATPAPPPVWPDPEVRTVVQAVQRLSLVDPAKLGPADLALQSGLSLALAINNGEADRAGELIDAIGYQPLPLTGELPESPTMPLSVSEVRDWVRRRPIASVGDLPLSKVAVADRRRIGEHFPAVAAWMLPDDLAVVFEPDGDRAHWVRDRCVLVIRMRGQRATVAGGNLVGVLSGTVH